MGKEGKSLQEMKKMANDRDKFRRWLHTPDARNDTKGQGEKKMIYNKIYVFHWNTPLGFEIP